jgi:Na+/H+ antiporter NhaA
LVVKLAEPVGVITVPTEVSVTVAVQLVPWLTTTDAGVHATLVEVVRGLTVTVNAATVALPE